MMLFNPLFVQNSPAEGAVNLKQNKLNPEGYLFSDIINVYMGNEEGMDGQVKEFNGEQVGTVVLNLEKEISINPDSESIKSKFEQLEKYLLQFSNGNELEGTEAEIKVENKNISLKEIKEIFASLVDHEITDESAEFNDKEFARIVNKLNNGDGISISFVGDKEVVNINISKEVAEDLTKLTREGNTKVFQLNFSIVHENNSISGNEKLISAQNGASVLAEEQSEAKLTSQPSLKIYSYQKNEEQVKNDLIDLTKLPGKAEEMYTSTRSVNNRMISDSSGNYTAAKKGANPELVASKAEEMYTSTRSVNNRMVFDSSENSTAAKKGANPELVASKTENEKIVLDKSNQAIPAANDKAGKVEINKEIQTQPFREQNQSSVKSDEKLGVENKALESPIKKQAIENILSVKENVKPELSAESKTKPFGEQNQSSVKSDEKLGIENKAFESPIKKQATENIVVDKEVKENVKPELSAESKTKPKNDIDSLRDIINNKTKVESKKEESELVAQENKEVKIKSKNVVKNISTIKEEDTVKVDVKESIKYKDVSENNNKVELNTKTETVKTEFSNQQNFNQQNENSKQTFGNFNNIDVNSGNNVEKSTFELPHQPADRIIKSTEILKELSNFIQKGEKTSIEFQVEPEQLGKLKIMLDITEQTVKANIRVETEAIKFLVENNIQDLQSHLNKQGIHLSSVNISLNDNNPKDAKNFASKKRNQTEIKNQKEIDSEEEKKEARMLGYNTVEYLA